jgi:hypothetical protein
MPISVFGGPNTNYPQAAQRYADMGIRSLADIKSYNAQGLTGGMPGSPMAQQQQPPASGGMQAFQQLLPMLLSNPAMFARPEAQAWLAQMMGGGTPGAAPGAGMPAGQGIPPGGAFAGLFTGGPSKYLQPPLGGGGLQDFTGEPGSSVPPPQPNPFQRLAGAGGILGRLAGRASGAMGQRGPEPSPFAGLRRFQGPFGNGGGAITPFPGGGGMGAETWRNESV